MKLTSQRKRLFRKLEQNSILSQTTKTLFWHFVGFLWWFCGQSIYQSCRVFHLTPAVLPQLRFHLIIGKAILIIIVGITKAESENANNPKMGHCSLIVMKGFTNVYDFMICTHFLLDMFMIFLTLVLISCSLYEMLATGTIQNLI